MRIRAAVCSLLPVVFAACATPPSTPQRARKALIIGIDGLRADQAGQAATPALDTITANGAIPRTGTNAWTAERAWNGDSATNWGVLLTGVSPARTGLEANGDARHAIADDTAALGSVRSLFGHLRMRGAGVETAVFHTWPGIGIGPGTVLQASASAIDHHFCPGGSAPAAARDDRTTAAVVDALTGTGAFAGANPDVLFVHLSQVDAAGHAHGYDAAEYRTAIENTDALVGAILDAVAARTSRDEEDWLVLVTADHGGPDGQTSHGDNSDPQVYTVPFWIGGDARGEVWTTEAATLYDVTPTVLQWMGVPPQHMAFDGHPLPLRAAFRLRGDGDRR